MAKLWTPQERKALREIYESFGDKAEYNKHKINYQFRQKFPHRSAEGVRAQLVNVKNNYEAVRAIREFVPTLQYNPVDVAFTRPVTKTDIIRHYRDMGLRGKVTIELGD